MLPAIRYVLTADRRRHPPAGWLVFAVVAVGVFMAQLDLFIVNIAFPAIERDFAGSSTARCRGC